MATPRSFDEAMGSDSIESDYNSNAARKRQRVSSNTRIEDEGSDDESDRPLLPDEYRRSPQIARATHQPGSIVRVTLNDFVTYTNAEFHPGPNLNMVIGPNGTGKSTLVCAICLGLGWGTQNLGRAKDISEFVKHGSTKARIEIELARDPTKQERNPIITTRITKEGNKVKFSINDKEATKAAVQKLANSFSIQVDNLCQFLPQDRVVEFASLSPVQLLTQTQRAAAPAYMSDWHDELKTLGKETITKQQEQQSATETLKKMKDRQRAQQADVDRIREHSTLQERLTALQKLPVFPKFREKKAEYDQSKAGMRSAAREIERLEREFAPNEQAVRDKKGYMDDIRSAMESKKRLVTRTGEQTSSINRSYEAKGNDVKNQQGRYEKDKAEVKTTYNQMEKIKNNILKIQNDMKNEPPAPDFASMNEEIRDLTRQLRSLEEREETLSERIYDLKAQATQREQMIRSKEGQKQHMNSQLGQLASKLGRVDSNVAAAWQWLEDNRDKCSGPVYGPPMITCTVRETHCTVGIEAVIGKQGLLAFTVTNKHDHELLQEAFEAKRLVGISVRAISKSLSDFTPPLERHEMIDLGLNGFALDLLDGPEHVLAMLCDNHGIEMIGYTTRALDSRQTGRLRQSPIQKYFTASEMFTTIRRKEYGDMGVSTSVSRLGQASLFVDNAPVNRDREHQLDRDILEARDEIEQLKTSMEQQTAARTQLREEKRELQESKTRKENTKSEQQRMRTAFEALPTKLQGQQDNLTAAEDKVKQLVEVCNGHNDKVDQLYLEKGQLAIDLANSVEQFRSVHMDLLAIELMELEAASDYEQLDRRFKEDTQSLKDLEDRRDVLRDAVETLRRECVVLKESCKEVKDNMTPSDGEIYQEVIEFTSDQLEVEIETTDARLRMNTGGNRGNIIREFEEREKSIQRKESQLAELRDGLELLETKIKDIREQWEPQLDEIIGKISASFAENFASINCAGEVGLYKDEDFEQWAIQIKVKFREQEPLSLLDSHRQSGGERAVSTIFYLMALQSLARAPFRVVDEINQGMDPRNERLVHSRLVSIACQSAREGGSGGSQYFLITPKLLNNLEYHPNMKVHCIASGEWMPKDHSSLDFGKLAQRALTLRAGSA